MTPQKQIHYRGPYSGTLKKIEVAVAAYTNRYRSRVDSTPGVMAQPDNQ